MSCDTYIKGESAIRRIDPRYRVLFALAFSLLIAVAGGYAVLLAALVVSAAAALAADLPARPLVRRLIGLNALTLTLFLLLPLSTPGDPLFSLGALAWSRQGMLTAGAIALKANTIVLAYTALVSTVDPIRLGGALQRLRVPAKLVQLLLFTIRYIGRRPPRVRPPGQGDARALLQSQIRPAHLPHLRLPGGHAAGKQLRPLRPHRRGDEMPRL